MFVSYEMTLAYMPENSPFKLVYQIETTMQTKAKSSCIKKKILKNYKMVLTAVPFFVDQILQLTFRNRAQIVNHILTRS